MSDASTIVVNSPSKLARHGRALIAALGAGVLLSVPVAGIAYLAKTRGDIGHHSLGRISAFAIMDNSGKPLTYMDMGAKTTLVVNFTGDTAAAEREATAVGNWVSAHILKGSETLIGDGGTPLQLFAIGNPPRSLPAPWRTFSGAGAITALLPPHVSHDQAAVVVIDQYANFRDYRPLSTQFNRATLQDELSALTANLYIHRYLSKHKIEQKPG